MDSDGTSIAKLARKDNVKHEVSRQVGAFAASLNWLSMRTAFYTLFSSRYEVDALLHPIRSAFQASLAGRLGLPEGTFAQIIKRFSDQTVQVVKDVTSASEPVVAEMDIPLFSAWLVGKSGSPRTAIEAAFEMRNEKPITEARQRLRDLEQASKEPSRKNFVRDVNRLVREVKSAGDTLRKLYGVETKNGVSVSPLISICSFFATLNGVPSLPSIPLKVPLPGKLLDIGIRRGFKGVCRLVTQDLVAVERLGQYHEKLTSEVRFKDGQRNTYLTKTEDVRFFGHPTYFKNPM